MIHRASTGSIGLWRALSWLLPSSAVLAVAVVGITARLPEVFLAARLYGGSGCEPATLRAIVLQSFGSVARRTQPFVGEVVLRVSGSDGAVLERRSTTTSDGAASFGAASFEGAPEWRPERLTLFAADSDTPLVTLSSRCHEAPPVEAPPAEASSRGGWIEGHAKGALTLRVGIAHGVLAVPFAAQLVVEVDHAGVPVSGANLSVRPVGAALLGDPKPTDASGVSRFELRPEAHVVELTIEVEQRAGSETISPGASAPNGTSTAGHPAISGRWFGVLPVVPGAMFTWRQDDVLLVASPIPREVAYVDLVASDRVIAALNVPLHADGLEVLGSVPLPEIARRTDPASLFAVVSSEPDLRSMARVGWPLDTAESRVRATRDVHSRLLVDGLAERREQRATAALWRRKAASAWVLLCAAGEGLVLWRLTRRPGSGAKASAASTPGRAWALACVALGLLGLAAFAWFL